ncbi:MAG: PEP-CTERM sorting domain-containing protein [Verrucomicrobia bacterium]|nr:PEP-CTERM sorting domain-containing protein [Verrucomicrobiota bacterium]
MSAINIDFGLPGAGPATSYAGAGTPGYWNVIDHVTTTGVGGILDTAGQPTSVLLTTSQNMVDVAPSLQPFNPIDAPLLGDYLVGGANTFTLTVTGLPESFYSVIVYTTGRQDFPHASTVTPFADPLLAEVNTGVYAGSLQVNVTHSIHELWVPSTGLLLQISSPADGFINGLQITPAPEPSTMALLFLGCIAALLRRRNG